MKISLDWLTSLCPTTLSAREIADLLTKAGTEVEHIEQVADDFCLHVEITSNRPDCYCHLGIARELSAITGTPLKMPGVEYDTAKFPVTDRVRVSIMDRVNGPRYTAQYLSKVKVKESPEWMRKRLETIGVTPVNSVVDITNYVLFEVGQPLHAFDAEALCGKTIFVRAAEAGEKMQAINHREYDLKSDMLVIADEKRPVAIAGVMGGALTEISTDTSTILLESAYFNPESVRRTSKVLGLTSDSSFRFERGVDPAGIVSASRRAAHLMVQLCEAEVSEGIIDENYLDSIERSIRWDSELYERTMGAEVDARTVARILLGLGLKFKNDSTNSGRNHSGSSGRTFEIPSFRRDLERPIDLVEEVARVIGFDEVDDRLRLPVFSSKREKFLNVSEIVRSKLIACGYHEAITDSFALETGVDGKSLWSERGTKKLRGSQQKERSSLRGGIAQSLLRVIASNQGHTDEAISFFEAASVFPTSEDGKVGEFIALSAVATSDYREIKGALEMLLEISGAKVRVEDFSHQLIKQGTGIRVVTDDDVRLAYFGTASAEVRKEIDLRSDAHFFELDLELLANLWDFKLRHRDFFRFPAAVRDFSVIVDSRLDWREIESSVRGIGLPHLAEIEFIEVYRDKRIPDDKKQFTFSVTLRAERTLAGDEISDSQGLIIRTLEEKHGATIRS
ncbi:MAG: phenylalanine--tRNA ligase subunit beta [Planctomycetes bacterium]|nr:phenylalanine--tRNA ligase subunit beta [Planctomycetota bacterium]